jgi:hypothetical protein
VLVGAIILKTVAESQQARDLGYGNLQIVDRDGQLLLAQLRHVENDDLLKRIDKNGSGVVSNTRGLDGESGHVVAYATSQVPDWVTVIDRPRSTVFAAAHRALVLELASVAAGVLFVVGILVYAIRRSRRHTEEQNERARSWSGLTRALGSASTEAEVADALLSSLRAAFPGAVAIVAFRGKSTRRVWRSSLHSPRARRAQVRFPTVDH